MQDWKGDAIKKARKKANLSQKELAEKIFISASALGQYERGIRDAKLPIMEKIAAALGISIGQLLGLQEGENSDERARIAIQSNVPINSLGAQIVSELLDAIGKKKINSPVTTSANRERLEADVAVDAMLHYSAKLDEYAEMEERQEFYTAIAKILQELNHKGQRVAIERLQELAMIPMYKRGE